MPRKVTFYYDVVSPYSWFGFLVLQRYKTIWNISLKLEPVFLGGIMAASLNQPPGQNHFKFLYINEDLLRGSTQFATPVPLKMPELFPSNSIAAMRILTALKLAGDHDRVMRLSLALWEMYWGRNGEFSPARITEVMSTMFSPAEIERLMVEKDSAAVKAELKAATNRATEHGAFGAPWIVVDGTEEEASSVSHSFFGSDRFEAVAALLGEKWLGPNPEGGKGAKM